MGASFQMTSRARRFAVPSRLTPSPGLSLEPRTPPRRCGEPLQVGGPDTTSHWHPEARMPVGRSSAPPYVTHWSLFQEGAAPIGPWSNFVGQRLVRCAPRNATASVIGCHGSGRGHAEESGPQWRAEERSWYAEWLEIDLPGMLRARVRIVRS